MTYKITLQPSGIQFDTQPGESVLEAALRAQIPFPHRCGQGGCSTCLCRKLDGEINYPHMQPFLTAREQEEGWIFACLAQAGTDLQLDLEITLDLEATPDLHERNQAITYEES